MFYAGIVQYTLRNLVRHFHSFHSFKVWIMRPLCSPNQALLWQQRRLVSGTKPYSLLSWTQLFFVFCCLKYPKHPSNVSKNVWRCNTICKQRSTRGSSERFTAFSFIHDMQCSSWLVRICQTCQCSIKLDHHLLFIKVIIGMRGCVYFK